LSPYGTTGRRCPKAMSPLEIAGGAKKADGRRGVLHPVRPSTQAGRKPSSVPRSRSPGGWSSVWDGCHQPPRAAYPRLAGSCDPAGRCGSHLAAYLALLRLGVTVPPLLPAMRWALTPPFHPCRSLGLAPGFQAVCFLWPCPSPLGAQALPGSLPVGARTFLEPWTAASCSLDPRPSVLPVRPESTR